ncbi:fungal-specific transcription factor domain-containing protein [Aspergillus bertholletiae]|uniref:Fungal-specific transcription factor domain-containing protein n=1 Tax=Aspergillus bertholletiae TaxID=1226010 RepID=A0A5N7AVJ1_9EURO|nr:fungal-specific transcription factor domain-containing protein [Aspergillus bertholletiae]
MICDRAKRTNSLAFAQSDCYTCASLGEKCDRHRPRCSTCLGRARKCGGFATPLFWDPRRMVNSPTPTATSVIPTTGPGPSKQFRFVRGATRQNKRRKEHSSRPKGPRAATPDAFSWMTGQDLAKFDEYPMGNSVASLQPQGGLFLDDVASFDTLLSNSFATPLPDTQLQDTPVADWMDISTTTDRPAEPALNGRQNIAPTLQDTAAAPSGSESHSTQGFVFSAPTRPGNDPRIVEITSVDHEELLRLYDSKYCVLPLTGDIPGAVNPFRCERQVSKPSILLIHAILALCCQHSERLVASQSREAAEHRGQAVRLLESALQNKPHLTLLDPILILFTLDCTLSAAGTWATKLRRTYSMLQTLGGTGVLTTPRIRAQVGMLIWWDATLALISRQSPIIDQSYLDFLVQWEQQDEWSFFDLTGCPRHLLVHLAQLAELANQSEIASAMQWLSFNMAPVTQIEHDLNHWNPEADSAPNNPHGSDLTDDEVMKQIHKQQDRYHCAEAWRQALLLYIEIIFKNDRKKRPFSVYQLVRKIIDNVRCCRRTSLMQKQLLIPVFLAGSETSDEDMRSFVNDYCVYWGEKTHYNMFNSVSLIFDEIWVSGKGWRDVIDSKTSVGSDQEHGTMQLLFG